MFILLFYVYLFLNYYIFFYLLVNFLQACTICGIEYKIKGNNKSDNIDKRGILWKILNPMLHSLDAQKQRKTNLSNRKFYSMFWCWPYCDLSSRIWISKFTIFTQSTVLHRELLWSYVAEITRDQKSNYSQFKHKINQKANF